MQVRRSTPLVLSAGLGSSKILLADNASDPNPSDRTYDVNLSNWVCIECDVRNCFDCSVHRCWTSLKHWILIIIFLNLYEQITYHVAYVHFQSLFEYAYRNSISISFFFSIFIRFALICETSKKINEIRDKHDTIIIVICAKKTIVRIQKMNL